MVWLIFTDAEFQFKPIYGQIKKYCNELSNLTATFFWTPKPLFCTRLFLTCFSKPRYLGIFFKDLHLKILDTILECGWLIKKWRRSDKKAQSRAYNISETIKAIVPSFKVENLLNLMIVEFEETYTFCKYGKKSQNLKKNEKVTNL